MKNSLTGTRLALAVLTALAGIAATPAAAVAGDVFMFGDKLYEACVKEPTFCQGYVSGVADVMFGTEEAVLGSRACPKDGTTIADASAAAVLWMEKNPARLNFKAFSVVAVALAESFPCE